MLMHINRDDGVIENFGNTFSIPEEVNVQPSLPARVEDDNEVQLSVAGSSRNNMSAIVADVLAAGAAEESGDIDFGRGNDDDSSEEQDFHETLMDELPSGVPASV
eukprot:scaffold46922_cov42-Attheya_sp.AAC.1